jgi:hypothetical protein
MTSQTVPTIQRGEIWNVDFDPQVGAEVRKIRPAVVMNIPTAAFALTHYRTHHDRASQLCPLFLDGPDPSFAYERT